MYRYTLRFIVIQGVIALRKASHQAHINCFYNGTTFGEKLQVIMVVIVPKRDFIMT